MKCQCPSCPVLAPGTDCRGALPCLVEGGGRGTSCSQHCPPEEAEPPTASTHPDAFPMWTGAVRTAICF